MRYRRWRVLGMSMVGEVTAELNTTMSEVISLLIPVRFLLGRGVLEREACYLGWAVLSESLKTAMLRVRVVASGLGS